MNKADTEYRQLIIQMARESGVLELTDLLESNQWRQDTIRELERFFQLATEWEREQCAKVADGYIGADPIAAAIRARGETK